MSTCSETLVDRVNEYLATKFDVKYTGNLDYTVVPGEDTNYYKLSWGLNQETYPFIMQGDFTNENVFYDYVVKQILITKFFETKRFIARRIKPPAYIIEDFKDALLTFDHKELC